MDSQLSQSLYLCPMIDLNSSEIRSLLFPALYEEEENILKLKDLAQFVMQKDQMKKLFLVKINQNFDLKSSNIYRMIAEQIGLNLESEEIKESTFFEQSDLPNFQQYIEEKQQTNRIKRSSSFTDCFDLDGQQQQEEKELFYEVQNTFFGRIPLYIKGLLSGKSSFDYHNQINRIIFMESNPFDLQTIYYLINETCSFLKCTYALNLFLSIQDYKSEDSCNNQCDNKFRNRFNTEIENNTDNQCIKNDTFEYTSAQDMQSQCNSECANSCQQHQLYSELVHSIILGTPLSSQIINSFTKQQIYFAFILISHITKICVLSFAMGLKNELDLGSDTPKDKQTTDDPFQFNQENLENKQQDELVHEESILSQLFNKQSSDILFFNLQNENEDDKSKKENQKSSQIQNELPKYSELESIKNIDQSTLSADSIFNEEDDMSSDNLDEIELNAKSTSRYSKIITLKETEYQEFFINSIEPYMSCQFVKVIDESYKYFKYNQPSFEYECGLDKESLLGYVQCLLNIKNYQFNHKQIEEIPQEIKKFIKCIVYNPYKINQKLVDDVRQYLPSFDLYTEFAEYICESIIFTNLTIFQTQNNL